MEETAEEQVYEAPQIEPDHSSTEVSRRSGKSPLIQAYFIYSYTIF